MFRSILVAIDGSEAAIEALKQATELARQSDGRLTLISVAVPATQPLVGPYVVPVPTHEQLEQEAERLVRVAAALVPEGVPVSTVVRHGAAAEAILDRIEHGEHDLVVMGSRGLGLAGSILLGSVSRAVVARSPVPVLIHPARTD